MRGGRLWIGTNDSGLSVCADDEITNVLDAETGLPSNSVRCIAGGGSAGIYYVGTADSMAVVSLDDEISVVRIVPEISYATSISVNEDGRAAVVTNEGALYFMDVGGIAAKENCPEEGRSFTCCTFDGSGRLYVGTTDSEVLIYETAADTLIYKKTVVCKGLTNIKGLNAADPDEVFVCADNGAGYLKDGKEYISIRTGKFNSSIDHMLIDYQGNLWFTSSRLGLLKLCRSAFTEIYDTLGMEENVVNAVTAWKGNLYVGTDSGLDRMDADATESKEDSLTKRLAGVRIRHLMVDSQNRLWVATSGKGVWRISKGGSVTIYDSRRGTLGDKFRMTMELSDGTMLLAGDSGLTYIKKDKIVGAIGVENGLENPKVLCMLEMPDGSVMAGTDGNGIAVIQSGSIVRHIKRADGLSSEVILRICKETDGNGYILVTGNGLCYMDEKRTIRSLTNFPNYNNFDVVEEKGKLFVLSSVGVYVMDQEELLGGGELEYMLLDRKKGLMDSITPNAWTYRDEQNNLYLLGGSGVIKFNLDSYELSEGSYRMRLQSVRIDGADCAVGQENKINIPSGAKRLEITPEVVNYSSDDPYVSIYLEGVDKEPQVMRQSECSYAAYTNLPAGTYTLHMSVPDENNAVILQDDYVVCKEYEIYEYAWFRGYMIAVFMAAVAYVAWLLFRTQIQRTLNIQKRELEVAQKQIEMGNEAILTIAKTVDAKDPLTSQHSLRVSEYAVLIASQIGYDKKAVEELRKTALLHDIGKIGIPDSILNKPSRLTDEEYDIMKSHVVKGAEILKNFTSVNHIVEGALYHHERYDGKGYMYGLKGEEIPLNARIIALADAFDAMTANRIYRPRLEFRLVIEELKKGKGTQFDPELAEVMLHLIETGQLSEEMIYR